MYAVMSVSEKEHVGAAAFAKAITQSEFGRFYWDELRESELRRSLETARARIKEERRARAKLEKRKK
jgi:hypothetical protein